MNKIEVRMCGCCRKIDRTENLVKTHCELTGISGWDHRDCLIRDYEWTMELAHKTGSRIWEI